MLHSSFMVVRPETVSSTYGNVHDLADVVAGMNFEPNEDTGAKNSFVIIVKFICD